MKPIIARNCDIFDESKGNEASYVSMNVAISLPLSWLEEAVDLTCACTWLLDYGWEYICAMHISMNTWLQRLMKDSLYGQHPIVVGEPSIPVAIPGALVELVTQGMLDVGMRLRDA
jgi:hypothetical protein